MDLLDRVGRPCRLLLYQPIGIWLSRDVWEKYLNARAREEFRFQRKCGRYCDKCAKKCVNRQEGNA